MAQGVFGGLQSLFASSDTGKGKLRCCWLFVPGWGVNKSQVCHLNM